MPASNSSAPPFLNLHLALVATDEDLFGRAVDGDGAAFRALMDRHSPAMSRAATRIVGSPLAADDAVQETRVIAWKRLAQVQEPEHVRGWLIRIATRQALTHLRLRRVEQPLPRGLPDSERNAPEVVAARNAQLEDLVHAVNALTTIQRQCWVLREMEQMRYSDIARATSLTPGQVRGNIARARLHVRVRMQGWQ